MKSAIWQVASNEAVSASWVIYLGRYLDFVRSTDGFEERLEV